MLRTRATGGFVTATLCALLFTALSAHAQQISGSITGTVKDSQQAVIASAKVTLVDQAQGSSRTVNTGSDGVFVFTPVQPGTYHVTVEATGFKKFEQTEVRLSASDRLTLGDLVMSVGSLTEVVTVEASAAQVSTQGADRSGILTTRQVLDLAMTGRNFLDLARVIPGVVYTSGLGGIQANGGRGNQNNLLLDGVTNVDTGSNGGVLATTNIDMIAEFKITTNSQPAEFGRSSGAQIQVVTKSGTQDFHGTGYLFHRHEGLNANSWRNNIENRPRNFYRYNYAGFNLGGPAYIPGKFNKEKNKLFFFIGLEWQNQLVPNGLRNVSVPTALERQGNFSQSREGGGTAVRITDPQNGGAPFPNMTIPANRLSADGVKILNFYPQPNAITSDPSFNYQSQVSDTYPRKERIFRGDYQISDKWRLYGRYIRTASETNKNYGQWNADYNIPFAAMNFGDPGWSFISNVTTIINPTLTNEFIFGTSKNVLNIDPVDNTFDRAKLGLSYKMPFPNADPLGLIQNWRWGGVPNGPTTAFNGTPFRNFNHTYDVSDNVSKVWGSHTIKAGLYLHKSLKDQTAFTPANGNIWFDRDASNPFDTNWAWANALTGTFQRVEQASVVLNGQYRYWNIETFLQDSWRVNSKLTIDYGMRFYWIQPQFDRAFQTGSFNPGLYDAASKGVLAQPYRDPATGATVAINPLNGQILPRALTGSIINTGKGFTDGLYTNAMARPGQNGYPVGLLDDRGLHYAPRVGIAYQFAPKTVFRAGAGVFYDRFQGNPVFDTLPNPPSTARPTFYYGQLASIPPASAGVFFPGTVIGFDKKGEVPTTYNWNATLQRELPGNILFDIGYVASVANHLIYRRNHNTVPLGSAWLAQNQDPLNSNPQFDGSTTQGVNFYRPYMGFSDANTINFGANSNYHSLQVSANRRFGNNMTFGVAYTWSRAMGTTSGDGDFNHPYNTRVADYGPLTFHRTHNLVFNYNYFTPKFIKSDGVGANVAKAFLHGWQVSGITTIQTGQPDNLSFGIDGLGNLNERFTGSVNVGARPIPKGSFNYTKTDYSWIDVGAANFATPAFKGSQGFDSGPRNVYRPGDHVWDISVFKNIPFWKGQESKYMQLRVEMFNAFNQVRFNDFNRSMTFSRDLTRVINLPNALGGNGGRFGFGSLTGTRDPRIIQLAAKIYF